MRLATKNGHDAESHGVTASLGRGATNARRERRGETEMGATGTGFTHPLSTIHRSPPPKTFSNKRNRGPVRFVDLFGVGVGQAVFAVVEADQAMRDFVFFELGGHQR